MTGKGLRDLTELFSEIEVCNSLPEKQIQLSGICIDSRALVQGNLFVAISGTRVDGHDFITSAVELGSAAVVGTASYQEFVELSVPYIQVEDTRLALAQLTAAWFEYPARKMVVIGVTGTDGKTTTVNLIYQILLAAGLQAGMISTVNAVIGNKILDTGFHVTTPEAQDVQRYLAEMVDAGISHVVLEATSHGLAQQRVAACEFDIGVVTNITHEHLDFHGDYSGYLNAKAELLRLVSRSSIKKANNIKLAVLNRDDKSYKPLSEIIDQIKLPMVDYGVESQADYHADGIIQRSDGIDFVIEQDGDDAPISTSLIGDYNVSNCLAAAAACNAGLGINWEIIKKGIQKLPGIPGRMERIDLGQKFQAVVDFAHTPNALSKALSSLGRQQRVELLLYLAPQVYEIRKKGA